MKFHATTTNENGAVVSKGGNEFLDIILKQGNRVQGTIVLCDKGILFIDSEAINSEPVVIKGKKQHGETKQFTATDAMNIALGLKSDPLPGIDE